MPVAAADDFEGFEGAGLADAPALGVSNTVTFCANSTSVAGTGLFLSTFKGWSAKTTLKGNRFTSNTSAMRAQIIILFI
jgi:hypothetical protein